MEVRLRGVVGHVEHVRCTGDVEPRRETHPPGFDAMPTGSSGTAGAGQPHVTVSGVWVFRAGSVMVSVRVVLSKW